MLTGPMTARRSNAKTAYGLMSDIAAYILEEPKRIYMGDWLITNMNEVRENFGVDGPACGTVGCVAGNAVLLTSKGSFKRRRGIQSQALQILAARDYNLADDLDCLFLSTDVSAPYGTEEYARIVAKRIADFQAAHEAELRKVRIER